MQESCKSLDTTLRRAPVLQERSYGVLRQPQGSVQLTIIELVAMLLRTGCEDAEKAIIGSSAESKSCKAFDIWASVLQATRSCSMLRSPVR